MTRSSSLDSVPAETQVVVGLISGSHFVNHMYLVLLPPILGLLATEFEVGLAALGIAMGVQGAVNTVFQLPYGYLSDTYSRSIALGLCLVFGVVGVFITALAPTYAWLLVGQAVLGFGIAGHHPAHYPLLADATPERYRGRAFSVHGFAGNLGFAAPPVFITAVIALSGLTWRHALAAIGVFGAVFTVAALVVLSRYVDDELTTPQREERERERESVHPLGVSLRQRVASEVRSLTSSPAILALAILATVTSTASWGVTSYAVVLLTDGYGVALQTANLGLTAMFVASAGMVLVGGALTDRFSSGPVLVTSFSLVAVFVVVFGSLAVPALVALASVVVIGGVRSLSAPARSKLADTLSARTDLGKNFAVITIGIMIGNSFAPPFFGILIDVVGLRTAFFAIAGFAILAVVITVAIIRSYGDGFVRQTTGQPSR